MKTHHRLTDLKIKTLPPGRISDGLNLYLETKADGQRRYWIFRHKTPQGVKWHSLGSYPKTSLRVAREKCRILNDQIGLGQDPWAAKVRVPTLAELADEYITHQLVVTNPKSRSQRAVAAPPRCPNHGDAC